MSLGADVVVSKLLKKSAQKALEVKAFNPNKISQDEYFDLINALEDLAGIKTAEQLAKVISKEQAQVLIKRYGVVKFINDAQLDSFLKITGNRGDLMNNLLLSLKEIIPNRNIDQLIVKFNIKKIPAPASLSNYQTRIWYTWKKQEFIMAEIDKISKLEDKAKKAFELRNEYRTAAREYMSDQVWKKFLEETETNYTWEQILAKTLDKDEINTLDEALEYIKMSSKTGRDDFDALLQIPKDL